MRQYVLVYDQKRGRLVAPIEAFDDLEVGIARRYELERHHRSEPNIEVVMLGAESEEQIRRTHSRYFESADQLLAGLTAALRAAE